MAEIHVPNTIRICTKPFRNIFTMAGAAGASSVYPPSFVPPTAGTPTEEVLQHMYNHVRACADSFLQHHQRAIKCRFTRTFDPDSEWEAATTFLHAFGFVVFRNAVDESSCRALHARIDAWLASLDAGVVAGQWDTYTNAAMPDGVVAAGIVDGLPWPPPSQVQHATSAEQPRARFDPVTHSQEAWAIRGEQRLYNVFRRVLRGDQGLRVSVDRVLYQRPMTKRPVSCQESWNCYERRPTLEYNPYRTPKIARAYQGLVALTHTDVDGGAPVVCPGFQSIFELFAHARRTQWASGTLPLRLDPQKSPLVKKLIVEQGVVVPLQRGSLLLVDQRVPRWGSPNTAGCDAFAALCVRMFVPTREDRALYESAVRHGLRFTNVPEATGHCAPTVRAGRAARFPYNYTPPVLDDRMLTLAGLAGGDDQKGSLVEGTLSRSDPTPAVVGSDEKDDNDDDDDSDDDDEDMAAFAKSLERYLLKKH